MNAFSVKFDLKVNLNAEDQIILMELNRIQNDTSETISRQILDLKEKAVKESLIKLGWTPPQ